MLNTILYIMFPLLLVTAVVFVLGVFIQDLRKNHFRRDRDGELFNERS